MRKVTTEEFIKRARAIHGDKYDYSKVVYVNTHTKVCIICPEHGEFWMTPANHLKSQRCRYCSGVESSRPDLSHIDVPEGSKAVPLTQDKYALVDEEDYNRVIKYKWYYTKQGYGYNDSVGYMHRFIMEITDPKILIDHKYHDTLDNRKSQLRVCTKQQNSFNMNSFGGVSIYKGVYWHKRANKWSVIIRAGKKRLYLGLFTDEEEAARAYDAAAKKYHKDFARLNFPE